MSKSIPIQSFRIHEEGLARLFGELEAKVMESIWALQDQEPTVQAVCDYLGPGHNYKTVMTVLNRLVEKGALTRQRRSRAALLCGPPVTGPVFHKRRMFALVEKGRNQRRTIDLRQ